MKNVTPLTTSQFIEKIYNYNLDSTGWVYLNDTPGVVIFHSDTSKFCTDLEPAIEIIAKKGKGRYNVYTVNADQERDLSAIFMIDNIPTFYLCPMKGDPTIVKGTINIKDITRLIDKIIAHKY